MYIIELNSLDKKYAIVFCGNFLNQIQIKEMCFSLVFVDWQEATCFTAIAFQTVPACISSLLTKVIFLDSEWTKISKIWKEYSLNYFQFQDNLILIFKYQTSFKFKANSSNQSSKQRFVFIATDRFLWGKNKQTDSHLLDNEAMHMLMSHVAMVTIGHCTSD